MIRCGHCGREHSTVDEVRACSSGAPPLVDVATAPSAAGDLGGADDANRRRHERAGRAATWELLAAPDVLGRWLAINPGDEIPSPWTQSRRVRVDRRALDEPGSVIDMLRHPWLARERLVVEIDDEVAAVVPAVEGREPWSLDPRFTFETDELAHLLWSNTVDGRPGTRVRWPLQDAAIKLGASPSAVADARLPSGEDVWCDGGPLVPAPRGLDVLHRVAIEHGSLVPLGAAGVKPSASTVGALAPDQLAAVTHQGAAARVIAPAGSGKTRVLTERARHLLRDWQVPASALTLVAFNVRAAQEMRERTTDLPGLQVRTLNSLALAIVNGSGRFGQRARKLETIDERDVRRIIDSLVDSRHRANADPTAVWIEALAAVRLGLRSAAEVESAFGSEVKGFAEMFPRYRQALADRGLLDFDEQIVAAISALLTEPATRATAQRACRVLLVDEFQDLAPAHLLLLRLVASPELAVYAVGDDDQTIYGYAGATPEWLIDFDRLFPGAGDHPLEVNYRCPPAVVAAVSNLLGRNRRRVAKRIVAASRRDERDGTLVVTGAEDALGATVARVQSVLAAGAAPRDVAVLTRVTASGAPVQVALRHHGIATTSAVGTGYLDRTGVRAALVWLRLSLAAGKLRAADIELSVRRPGRGVSPRVVGWMAECRDRDALTRLARRLSSDRDAAKVDSYIADLALVSRLAMRGAPTVELLAAVRDEIGLDDAMAKLDGSRADAQSAHIDDLDALVSLARLHPDPATFGTWLHDELSAPGDSNGVMLSSIHRVKGREWPHVVLHDVRDGLVPHRLAADREEERRVFHVGLTRAISSVTVVGDPARPSPFVAELTTPPPPSVEQRGAKVASRRGAPRADQATTRDDELRQALRAWRSQRAKEDAVPAYVVCTNVTLDAVVEVRPRTLDDLRRVPGIGPAKRERYGQAIVDIVNGAG